MLNKMPFPKPFNRPQRKGRTHGFSITEMDNSSAFGYSVNLLKTSNERKETHRVWKSNLSAPSTKIEENKLKCSAVQQLPGETKSQKREMYIPRITLTPAIECVARRYASLPPLLFSNKNSKNVSRRSNRTTLVDNYSNTIINSSRQLMPNHSTDRLETGETCSRLGRNNCTPSLHWSPINLHNKPKHTKRNFAKKATTQMDDTKHLACRSPSTWEEHAPTVYDFDTVYAIFAHEEGKSHPKLLRLRDSVQLSTDYIEKRRLHEDSLEGFQDVDLSIDPKSIVLAFGEDDIW